MGVVVFSSSSLGRAVRTTEDVFVDRCSRSSSFFFNNIDTDGRFSSFFSIAYVRIEWVTFSLKRKSNQKETTSVGLSVEGYTGIKPPLGGCYPLNILHDNPNDVNYHLNKELNQNPSLRSGLLVTLYLRIIVTP